MQNARSPSDPTLPWMLMPLVHLLEWGRDGVHRVVGRPARRHGAADVGGALLLVGTITLAGVAGAPPLVTLGGGVGLAVLFVVARSWMVVRDEKAA